MRINQQLLYNLKNREGKNMIKKIEGFGKYKSGRTTAQFHANGTH